MAMETSMMDRRKMGGLPAPGMKRPVSRLDEAKQIVAELKAKGLLPGMKGEGPITVNGKAAAGVVTQVVKVTPEMAKEWLARNSGNRNLRESAVIAFARDMKAGNWALTHQGVAFSAKGKLIDGQHRLAAVVKAGIAVGMMVTTGLPEKHQKMATMDAVDRGAQRSVADQMSIQHGINNAPLVSAAALVIAQVCVRPERLMRVTVPQVLQILDVYGEAIAWAVDGMSGVKQLKTAPVLGAVAFAWAHEKDRVMMKEFYHSFVSGENLGPGSPILLLRNYLVATDKTRGSHHQRSEVTERVLLAIYEFLHGSEAMAGLTKKAWHEGMAFRALAEYQPKNVERVKSIFKL